jgi:hypothetical protein
VSAAAPLQPLGVNSRATPPLPAEKPRSQLPTLVLACDIDHTLINQTLTVLPREMGQPYPGLFPPWGRHAKPPPDPLACSEELRAYLEAHRHALHITGITDDKRWPASATSLSRESKERPEELMTRFIGELSALLKARKAVLVFSQVRSLSPHFTW